MLGLKEAAMTRAETFPMLAMREAEDWVGRTEERWGCLTPELAGNDERRGLASPFRSGATCAGAA